MNKSRMSTAESRRRATAHHEAGHAVMATILGFAFKCVSIESGDGAEGRVTYTTPKWVKGANLLDFSVRRWVEANIMSQMAGFIAERHYQGRGNHAGASGDCAGTYELACMICLSAKEAALYLDALFERTSALMQPRIVRRAVSAVARALLREKNLTRREVRSIVDDVFA